MNLLVSLLGFFIGGKKWHRRKELDKIITEREKAIYHKTRTIQFNLDSGEITEAQAIEYFKMSLEDFNEKFSASS